MPASSEFTTWGPADDPLALQTLPVTFYSGESVKVPPPFPRNDTLEIELIKSRLHQWIEGANWTSAPMGRRIHIRGTSYGAQQWS